MALGCRVGRLVTKLTPHRLCTRFESTFQV
jgi:hypothetical protein